MKKGFFHDERKPEAQGPWIYFKLCIYFLLVRLKPGRSEYRRKLEDIQKQIQASRNLRVNGM